MPSKLRRVGEAFRRPGPAFAYLVRRAKGEWYRFVLPLLGHRFQAGRGLQVSGRLWLKGPGRVELGNDVQLWLNVTPWTHSEQALIRVGDGTVLGGARLGCAASIEIGRDCIIADCRIMDTDFHSVQPNRRDPAAPIRTAPVLIEDNVWIAGQVGIMPGTRIGTNSVVSFGAICAGQFPANVVVVGNPARVAAKITPTPSQAGPAEGVGPGPGS